MTIYAYAKYHFAKSFMLSVTNNTIMLNVVMLNVIMLNVVILNVVVLNVVMLNVVMLNVRAPKTRPRGLYCNTFSVVIYGFWK